MSKQVHTDEEADMLEELIAYAIVVLGVAGTLALTHLHMTGAI